MHCFDREQFCYSNARALLPHVSLSLCLSDFIPCSRSLARQWIVMQFCEFAWMLMAFISIEQWIHSAWYKMICASAGVFFFIQTKLINDIFSSNETDPEKKLHLRGGRICMAWLQQKTKPESAICMRAKVQYIDIHTYIDHSEHITRLIPNRVIVSKHSNENSERKKRIRRQSARHRATSHGSQNRPTRIT